MSDADIRVMHRQPVEGGQRRDVRMVLEQQIASAHTPMYPIADRPPVAVARVSGEVLWDRAGF